MDKKGNITNFLFGQVKETLPDAPLQLKAAWDQIWPLSHNLSLHTDTNESPHHKMLQSLPFFSPKIVQHNDHRTSESHIQLTSWISSPSSFSMGRNWSRWSKRKMFGSQIELMMHWCASSLDWCESCSPPIDKSSTKTFVALELPNREQHSKQPCCWSTTQTRARTQRQRTRNDWPCSYRPGETFLIWDHHNREHSRLPA